MLEKETNETGRHSKIIIGPQSSDEEADDEEEQSAQVYLTVLRQCIKHIEFIHLTTCSVVTSPLMYDLLATGRVECSCKHLS